MESMVLCRVSVLILRKLSWDEQKECKVNKLMEVERKNDKDIIDDVPGGLKLILS